MLLAVTNIMSGRNRAFDRGSYMSFLMTDGEGFATGKLTFVPAA
jgi:hypothetical protein